MLGRTCASHCTLLYLCCNDEGGVAFPRMRSAATGRSSELTDNITDTSSLQCRLKLWKEKAGEWVKVRRLSAQGLTSNNLQAHLGKEGCRSRTDLRQKLPLYASMKSRWEVSFREEGIIRGIDSRRLTHSASLDMFARSPKGVAKRRMYLSRTI